MRAAASIALAMILYGMFHVIIKNRFSNANQFVSMFYVYTPFVLVAGTVMMFGRQANGSGNELTLPYTQICLIVAGGIIVLTGVVKMPTGQMEVNDFTPPYAQICWMLTGGAILLVGDYFLFSGYRLNATVEMATAISVLLPLSAIAAEVVKKWEMPNKYTCLMLLGITFVIVMGVLSQKEEEKRTIAKQELDLQKTLMPNE